MPFYRRFNHFPAQDPSEAFRHVVGDYLCGRCSGDGTGHLGRLRGLDAGILHRRTGRYSAAKHSGEHGRSTLPPHGRTSLADKPPQCVAIPLLVCAGTSSACNRFERVHGDCSEELSPPMGRTIYAILRHGLYVHSGAVGSARKRCPENYVSGSGRRVAKERVAAGDPESAAPPVGFALYDVGGSCVCGHGVASRADGMDRSAPAYLPTSRSIRR